MLNVYVTPKTEQFPTWNLFIVDGDIKPKKAKLKGQEKEDVQKVLTLYQDGLLHENTGIYGYSSSYGAKGMEYVGKGLFYIIHPYKTWYGKQTAVAYLYVWTGSTPSPFRLAAGVSDNYAIAKKVATTKAKESTTKNK